MADEPRAEASKADGPEAKESKKSQSWLTIFTTVLTVLSALGVAYLSFQSKSVDSSVKREDSAFQQSKFDAEKRAAMMKH